jgi:hypothetical protein
VKIMSRELILRIGAATMLTVGWFLSYSVWPPGVLNTPMSVVTVLEFMRMFSSALVAALAFAGTVMLWIGAGS